MYGYIAVRNILSARFGAFSFVVLVSRESLNLSTTYASVIYGNKKIQLKLRMRALWSKAFSLVFYLKVNSTFQNWTIIFVHFEISENSFELFVLLKREADKRGRQKREKSYRVIFGLFVSLKLGTLVSSF